MGSAGSSRYGKTTTAKQIIDDSIASGADLRGKVAVVTGGNCGIGLETCKAFASAGMKVVLCSRSVKAGEESITQEIKQPGVGGYVVASPDIVVKQLDLSSFDSVRALAEDLNQNLERIDYLVLNAGVMQIPTRQLTEQGFESQIGINHFGHFYLTSLLLPKMKAQNFPSRIVAVSSLMHKYGSIDLNDLHYQNRQYSPIGSYGQSKLANLLFAKSLADQLKDTPITALSLHPGVIHTRLIRHAIPQEQGLYFNFFKSFFVDKTIPQGAATTVYACLAPELQSHSGAYLSDCNIANPSSAGEDSNGHLRRALWELTERQIQEALSKKN